MTPISIMNLLLAEQVKPCSAPPGISDGRTTNKLLEEYPHGAQVDYECNDQFAMVGSSKIECVDGEWTTLPSCTGNIWVPEKCAQKN